MENIGSYIQKLNFILLKQNFRIGHSAKKNIYYILDIKHSYKVYEFKNINELKSFDNIQLKKIIQNYKKSSSQKTVLKRYKESLDKYFSKFGIYIKDFTDDKIILSNGDNIISFTLKECEKQNISKLKRNISYNIKKLVF